MNDDSAASSRCRPTLKLLKGKLLSITRSLLALKRWQQKPSFYDPKSMAVSALAGLLESRLGAVVTVWPLTFLLPRRGAETQLLVQADFVQLWDIPSVKCHLFYIHNTVLKLPSDAQFFFWPPMPGFIYCPRREIWKQRIKWNVLFFFLFFTFCAHLFFLFQIHHSLSF